MAITILECAHEVVDQDPQFFIDPDTMKITSGANNLTIPQRATNAERLTFYLPEKIIEGHDLSACNQVLVHYRNIEEETLAVSLGVDKVTDLQVYEDGSVTLSWLIGGDATVYAGGLIFSLHFACIADDGTVLYNLPTLTYSGIVIGETVWNSETIARQYPDIIAAFEQRISAIEFGPNGAGPVFTVNGKEPDKNGNVSIPAGGATTEEVLAALPQVTAIDFSNFENGSFTEVVDGETVTHYVSFDANGRPTSIDGITITWEAV